MCCVVLFVLICGRHETHFTEPFHPKTIVFFACLMTNSASVDWINLVLDRETFITQDSSAACLVLRAIHDDLYSKIIPWGGEKFQVFPSLG